jgi:ATP-dependent HslUV protease ATP-binding subunit HslU
VELQGLTRQDFYRVLTEPEFSLIKQQQALLAAEGVALEFTDAAVQEIAAVAEQVGQQRGSS